jgi:hypothetical protein
MTIDFKGGHVEDWLVTGWFTPDYRPVAEVFAGNLSHCGVPFHLFARSKLSPGWDTTQKPSVVLDAMDAYPGRSIALLDVDCLVRGDPAPVTRIGNADVGIVAIARDVGKGETPRHWLQFETSSRVMVFHPTEGARTATPSPSRSRPMPRDSSSGGAATRRRAW